jgi:ribokinase
MSDTGQPRHGVTILGSANLDVVFTVRRIPRPGETLLAESVGRYPGGKGLNQAVAAARSGAETAFIGDELARTMTHAGIESGMVRREDAPTGQAFIVVDDSGENTIIVASGANATVTTLRADEERGLAGSAVLLMQLELPVEAVVRAAECAHAGGAIVMLNAAPARPLPEGLLASVDCLIVNEHEACISGGSDELATASTMLAGLVPRLIVTLGAAGSVLYEAGSEVDRIAAPRVSAVDSTGAGDTFCGAFATAIAEGMPFVEAARFATAAATLSVQSIGAVPSVPTRAAISAALAAADEAAR